MKMRFNYTQLLSIVLSRRAFVNSMPNDTNDIVKKGELVPRWKHVKDGTIRARRWDNIRVVRLNRAQLVMAKRVFRMGPLMGIHVGASWEEFRCAMWFRPYGVGDSYDGWITVAGGSNNECAWHLDGDGTLHGSNGVVVRIADA